MKIKKFHIYLADLNPRYGTEAGKIRPVVVVQTDLLNEFHPSTLVCPVSTNVIHEAKILRVHLGKEGVSGLNKESDLLVDQIRSIDNRRFKKEVGVLTEKQKEKLLENLKKIILE